MKISVYDPPMCCSTGVCGPSVNPELVRFAADLEWLKQQGIEVERFNLSQQPVAFVNNSVVKLALNQDENCLPLTLAEGEVVCRKEYPTREMLASYAKLNEKQSSLFTEKVRELVAVAASIGSNCESCFKFHYAEAMRLGISKEDLWQAVQTALAVKKNADAATLATAEKYLHKKEPSAAACCEGGCCGG